LDSLDDLLFSHNNLYKALDYNGDLLETVQLNQSEKCQIYRSNNRYITFEDVLPLQTTKLYVKDGMLNKTNKIYDSTFNSHTYLNYNYKI
jgi:hypothetical protein